MAKQKLSPRAKSLRNPKIRKQVNYEWLILENLLKATKACGFTTKEALDLLDTSLTGKRLRE